MIHTLDKLAAAIQAERERHGGEGRKVFFDLDSRADLQYDLKAREVAGFLRTEANREALLRRLGATSVEYRPSKYHKASGGGYDVGFVQYRERPGRRDPASVKVTFGEGLGSTVAHATKKSSRQLDAEIAAALAEKPPEVPALPTLEDLEARLSAEIRALPIGPARISPHAEWLNLAFRVVRVARGIDRAQRGSSRAKAAQIAARIAAGNDVAVDELRKVVLRPSEREFLAREKR